MTVSLPAHLDIPIFARIGVRAFVTTRAAGDFNLSPEADGARDRWAGVQQALAAHGAPRLASAKQVHGTRVLVHTTPWDGWLRVDDADGHLVVGGGGAAVTIADCVPVFIAHPAGAVAAVHAGWRGTAGGILQAALRLFAQHGFPVDECLVHLGPSICGRCYEVGTAVYEQLTGWETRHPRRVDLRALLADQAKELGVRHWSASGECTRCDNDALFSHRAGDAERQIGVIFQVRT
jgi:YfiH family protein